MRRLVLVLVMLVVAYAVGWMSDWVLNDDPCATAAGSETDTYEPVQRWLPVRTDCVVTDASGGVAVERGPADVFLAMFALTLTAGLALLVAVRLIWRVFAVVAATLGAFLVIFIV